MKYVSTAFIFQLASSLSFASCGFDGLRGEKLRQQIFTTVTFSECTRKELEDAEQFLLSYMKVKQEWFKTTKARNTTASEITLNSMNSARSIRAEIKSVLCNNGEALLCP